MDVFLEILKYTLPTIVVFLTAYFTLTNFLKHDQSRRMSEIALKNQDIITPIRFQAYERLILFLERISPEALIVRINKQGMTGKQLHSELLAAIRAEFEHNLAQQIYLSPASWEVIKSAKGNMIKLINQVAEKTDPAAPSINLSKAIIEAVMDMDQQPTAVAIDYLKQEVQQFF